ncbi:hypothetical protein LPB301_12945 [Polaribacter reichenbachii]|uniref:Uncharacterized protein n=1 Tax=Polaribacter reichenbachii TaxID=996801 RepID=A0A1B8TW30_9FLAO|nr:hypothetical protein LPB301_12945 [Polaribacter reichenbachii]
MFFSCSEDNDITTPRNLEEYINANTNRELDEVIACAASEDNNTSLTNIFYYPIEGATEIKYFETESTDVDEKDFSNYRRELLTSSDVFGGKLEKFSRSDSEEAWCIVTFLTNGKLHKSNPIRLKNETSSTIWEEEVTIDQTESTMPKFTWSEFGTTDNAIFFQVISDEDDEFISGTYTYDNYFQFYDTSNVVLNINTVTPENLVVDNTYSFTLMAVSEDNWVNLVIQNQFTAQ